MFSIRRFLISSLLLMILLGGFALAWMTYQTLYHELDEQYDAELVQSAHLLAGFWQEGHPPEASLAILDQQQKRATRYFVYQLWRDGALITASSEAPMAPMVALRETPHYAEEDGWHSYALPLSGKRWLVLAESDRTRRSTVNNMAATVLAPYLVSVPILVLLVWLAIRRGLSPLAELARSIGQRSPDNLSPLPDARPVAELQPIRAALNQLLERLEQGIAREKRFTADAAHELRTLLMVLRLHAENAGRMADPEQVRASLLQLETAIQRAERMLEQLLSLARLDPANASVDRNQSCDAAMVARETVAGLIPLADRFHQQLEVWLDQPVPVALPREGLQMILRNLIDNACRYAPPGSIVVACEQHGGRVRLTVSDAGDGLSEAQQERFSERFSRGHTDRDGAGLGLSIVDGILSLYGGSLRYRRRDGASPAAAVLDLPAAAAA